MRTILIKHVIIAVIIIFAASCSSSTKVIVDDNGATIPNSISLLESVKIGNINQCILARGVSPTNPIIIYLHGGPGSPVIPVVNKYNSVLEKHFIVVQWDQRGSGKSYYKDLDERTMNINQFVSDLHELIGYLKTKFNKKKVYIIGHSWGSALGLLYVNQYPDDCIAYIGTGQSVNVPEAEAISYDFALSSAIKNSNKHAIDELQKIGKPPYTGTDIEVIKKITTQRKWLIEFGGQYYDTKNKDVGSKLLLSSHEYSLGEKFNYMKGMEFSLKTVGKEYMKLNLFDTIKELHVPLYFCIGRKDYTTPFELVEKFYNTIKAPKKELIWFDKSAHSPIFEESEKFNDIIINRVLKETSLEKN